jgi:hypothetical protein
MTRDKVVDIGHISVDCRENESQDSNVKKEIIK